MTKILNLVYPDKSEIRYKINKYPCGQRQVVITMTSIPEDMQIEARLTNFQDLELIICATQSLRELGVKDIHLYTPYFLGSRSDRRFEIGDNHYLKTVICPIINSLNFASVAVLDPHSDVLEACLNNFKKQTNHEFVKQALVQINNKTQDNIIFLSPDAGASKKIEKVAEYVHFKGDIITCSKERDIHGKLTKTVIPPFNSKDKDIIIIDDICDGGGTFINIAKELTPYISGKLYLVVTHGIFSKGFGELQQYFEAVYTTNSYKDFNPDTASFVKQLNIF